MEEKWGEEEEEKLAGTDLQELVEEEGEPVGQHLLGDRLRPGGQEDRK